ncbi:hypothetical protein PFICI_09834 [Pestalotiopsis fici W106-1]|uniref:2EXR domain-containing protein n=1 Tax=Pestalotiopsis fici (strain W106-1 / CGMCC3.15140) TaxID=1229662 RepID=W3WXE1_PESFW|nr:uncharacterized protein PFICI_09834 [Pestalotiopsis fici W106-1]ETS77772.1 hypothetical protein PFICI_09834 [Pestalotiopsis fici W106-1]
MAGSDVQNDSSGSDDASGPEVAEDINDDDTSEESSSSSDDGEAHNFLDLEASESCDSEDSEDRDDDIDASPGVEHSFPQFSQLPPELRQRIWGFFDPHLRSPARVFSFRLVQLPPYRIPGNESRYGIWEDPSLDQQTEPARTLLAINHESRCLARTFYPHNICVEDEQLFIPCHKTRDIVRIVGPPEELYNEDWNYFIDPLIRGFHQVAFQLPSGDEETPGITPSEEAFMSDAIRRYLLTDFPELTSVFKCSDEIDCRTSDIQWCTLDSTHNFYVETSERSPGLGEDMQYIFCWPKIINGTRSTDKPFSEEPEREYRGLLPPVDQLEEGKVLSRMIHFSHSPYSSGLSRFDKIRMATFSGSFENYESSDSESESEETNEYESSGIDDESIDDDMGSDDEENDLAALQSSPVDHESPFQGFSSPLGMDIPELLEAAEAGMALEAAIFSDIESDPSDESDHAQPQNTNQRQRRVIADSSDEADESESPQNPSRKRPRARVIESDSDEDSQSPKPVKRARTEGRASRVVLSESDDEDESDHDETTATSASKRRARGTVRQDDSQSEDESDDQSEEEDESEESGQSSDDDEEDEEEEEQAPQRMSLAERIGAFRAAVPAGDEAESSPEAEYDEFNDEGDEGYGGAGYGAFQDDEEDDGRSDREEMIMDMDEEASEGEEGEEDGW